MKRFLSLTIATSMVLSATALAATPERIHGTVTSVAPDSVTINTAEKDVTVGLTAGYSSYDEKAA